MATKKGDVEVSDSHRIRFTLTSKDVKALEKVTDEVCETAADQGLAVRGPTRLPTKTLRITTRKSPCGEGTNTWDRFQMRIHKRLIDLIAVADAVRTLTQKIHLNPHVTVEVTIMED